MRLPVVVMSETMARIRTGLTRTQWESISGWDVPKAAQPLRTVVGVVGDVQPSSLRS